MTRLRTQQGSSLILLIGMVAALAILATTLVALTINVSGNTATDRTKAKAFSIAEAGMDNGLFVLGRNWPTPGPSPSTTPTLLPSVAPTPFRAAFSTTEYPNPIISGAKFVDVQFYDNSDTNGDGVIDNRDAHYDANEDFMMFVDTQATVGNQTARVRALVEMSPVNVQLPRGIALYAGGDLRSHGGGTSIDCEVFPPGSNTVTVWVGGTLTQNGSNDFASCVNSAGPNVTGSGVAIPPANSVFSPEVMDALKQVAQEQGRYYTDVSAATAALATGPLVYLKTTSDITITANGTFNGDGVSLPAGAVKPPGILIVDGGGVTFHGTPTYYGVVICRGGFVDTGNASIHGMVVSLDPTKGSDIGGSEQIVYNDNVIQNISKVIPLAAQVVPNTWRQLSPR